MFRAEGDRAELNPNPEWSRRWVYREERSGAGSAWIMDQLKRNGVSANTHPSVCDLCSGDGSVPYILVRDGGWKQENITCIDEFVSPDPLLTGVKWKYFDVTMFVWSLKLNETIPDWLLSMRSTFDLVTLFNGDLGKDIEQKACRYFVKPGGFVLCPSQLGV